MTWQTYVAIGDSLTAGTGDQYPGIEHLSWSDRLAQALAPHAQGFNYHNLAVRGKTSAEMIAEQLPRAVDLKPDFVTILAGGNDIRVSGWHPEQFRQNLTKLVQPFAESGATVALVAMIDNHLVQPVAMQEHMRPMYAAVRLVNRVVREVARDYGLLLIDLEQVVDLHDMEMISADGIHANSYGYIKIAAEAARQLSAHTGLTLAHPALNVPDFVPQRHRVFREMLHQMDFAAHDAPELIN
jgi:lysophospholipase L1-like esterase